MTTDQILAVLFLLVLGIGLEAFMEWNNDSDRGRR